MTETTKLTMVKEYWKHMDVGLDPMLLLCFSVFDNYLGYKSKTRVRIIALVTV
jgi:hypothetical protein